MANKDDFFEERQRFRHPLIFLLLAALLGLSIWGIIQQIVLDQPFGTNPAPDYILILFSLIPVILILFFILMQQRTYIDHKFIDVFITPFGRRKISWDNIEEAYIRDYKPLLEYGGWGIRYGFGGRGVAYSVGGGRKGLQLTLKNGQKILIGTHRGGELEAFLKAQQNTSAENTHQN